MKTRKNFKKATAILVVLALLVLQTVNFSLVSVAETLPIYNAYDDYKTETQSGVWSYQEVAGNVYTDMAWDSANSFWHTNAYVKTSQDIYMTGQNMMWFHPGAGIDSVVTFTAPKSGIIRINSASGYGVAVGDDSVDGIVFTIKNGNTNLFAPTVITKSNRVGSGNNINFNIATSVKAGDKIHFIVGMNGTNQGDATYVTPKIEYSEVFPTYNAYNDYSTVTQTGAWSYQEASNGQFTDLAWDASLWHTNAYVQTSQDVYMTGANTMWFHPGGGIDSVVTFTAPKSGTITIKSSTGYGVAVADSSVDGIVFTIKNGSTDLFAPTVITKSNRVGSGNNIDFNITTDVKAGDKIHFMVGMNGNNAGDATYVTPVIAYTEYSTFNARDNYTTGTQIGLWNYQERSGNVYTNLNWNAANNFWFTNAYVSTNPDVYMTGQNTIWFHPGGGVDSVVTFTAPKSGSVTIKSSTGLGIAVGDDSADGIVFSIKNGDTDLFAPTVVTKSNRIANGTNVDFNITTLVNAGDKIHFIVGMNGNNAGDQTFVTPVIDYIDTTVTITGVVNNATYDLHNGPVVIGFNTGSATINGYPIGSGHNLTTSGSYTLTVTSITDTKTYNFTVMYLGDVDNNSTINVGDLVEMKKHLLKITSLEGISLINAKMTGKATIGISDFISLKKILLNIV